MKKTEYQIEVSSLRLSEQFKADLKAKMLEEYEKAQEAPVAEEKPVITVSGNKWKKYSKYAAVAACLLIAVSTASVLSIKGIKTGEVSNDSATEMNENTADDNILAAPVAVPTEGDLDGLAVPQEGMNDELPEDVAEQTALEESEVTDEEIAPFYDDANNTEISKSSAEETESFALGIDDEEIDEAPISDGPQDVEVAYPRTNPPEGYTQTSDKSDISAPQECTTVDEESECDYLLEITDAENTAPTVQSLSFTAKSGSIDSAMRSCSNYGAPYVKAETEKSAPEDESGMPAPTADSSEKDGARRKAAIVHAYMQKHIHPQKLRKAHAAPPKPVRKKSL